MSKKICKPWNLAWASAKKKLEVRRRRRSFLWGCCCTPIIQCLKDKEKILSIETEMRPTPLRYVAKNRQKSFCPVPQF